ncbi:MAG: helix-hairpin-helix domain-containing protein, partial [Candidatus Omnitrophica bacterium]|nr:helix-hairpin-helix domain-containing protein [Candidatus Omnitrophota bacterium]
VMAREIISHRDSSGGFKAKEDLKDVKGIGDKKFEKMKDLIIISE